MARRYVEVEPGVGEALLVAATGHQTTQVRNEILAQPRFRHMQEVIDGERNTLVAAPHKAEDGRLAQARAIQLEDVVDRCLCQSTVAAATSIHARCGCQAGGQTPAR